MNPHVKNILMVIVLMSFSAFSFAQSTATSNSSMATKPMSKKDFRKFSIGINAGALNPAVAIGGSNDFTNPQTSFGYGGNIRYQLANYFGIEADFLRGDLKGDNSEPLYDGGPLSNRPVSSFKTDLSFAASGVGVFTFPILFAKPKIVPYLFAGAGIAHYTVKIVNRGSSNEVDYAANDPIKEFFVPVGGGLKIKLSNLLNIDLGYKAHFVDGNNFDGTRLSVGSNHKDKFQYGFAGLEFSFGKKANEQLMFYDPAAHMADQVARLQTQIDTLFSRLNIIDTDNDGVIDQLDKEPATAAGCPVNTHGESLDTDGDGVPDCKDKEKITPTFCQPVDADGVGKCPPPECCANMVKENGATACQLGDLPSLSFKGNQSALSSDAKAMLATVASKLKSSPTCTVTIAGYPSASKTSQALCNKRLDAVKTYLFETEGLSQERITTICKVGDGDANTIDITGN